MTEHICSFEGCGRPIASRSLCQGHYAQYRRGKTLAPLARRPARGSVLVWLREAIMLDTDSCIEWPFARSNKGYGQVRLGGRQRRAHVIALTLVRPRLTDDGPCVLHSCDNPPCVNPSHLSWGTVAENNRQMMERGRMARLDKCMRGHEWTPESTIIRATGKTCRICRHEREREYRRARLPNATI